MFEGLQSGEYKPNDLDEAKAMLKDPEFARANAAIDEIPATGFDPKREIMKTDLAQKKLSERSTKSHEQIREAARAEQIFEPEEMGVVVEDDLEGIDALSADDLVEVTEEI